MILLWGLPGERPLELVRSALGDLRQPVFMFDQRNALDLSIELRVDGKVDGRLIGPAGTIDLAKVASVYVRPYDPTTVPAVAASGAGSRAWVHARELYEAFRVWTEVTPALVVNRGTAMASNNSKPYQAALLRSVGFHVPTTLVTTDADAARAFVDQHHDVVYKSVSSVRSIVARYTKDHEARLQHLATCPTQFQTFVAGTDVRVHVVGDQVFACEVSSSATDYRYPGAAGVDRKRTDVPADVAERCRTVTRGLGLHVAGIDLRRTSGGDWYAFEVNPSPAFSYFDLDGTIARAIAALLASGTSGGTP